MNNFIAYLAETKNKQSFLTLDIDLIKSFIDSLFQLLYICKKNKCFTLDEISTKVLDLKEKLSTLLEQAHANSQYDKAILESFFSKLKTIHQKSILDAQAIYEQDPAAHSIDEVCAIYPGFFATAVYRIANHLQKASVPLLPRIFSEYAHSQTGIDIHPAATIGSHFAIDHGTGIVIGETAIIGNYVTIYQAVTLGALSISKSDYTKEKRHPTIEDNVTIYAGATILGGETTIAHDSIIGGNVWITSSVEPFSVVMQEVKTKIKDKRSFKHPINYTI